MKAKLPYSLPFGRYLVSILILFTFSATSFSQMSTRNKMALRHEDVSGFCDIVEVGGAKGIGHVTQDFTAQFASISNVFGYVINHHYIIGLGIGAHAYNGGMRVPAYLDIRYRFRIGNTTPFLYTDAGGLINFNDVMNYGILLNPGIGIMTKTDENMVFTFSIGFFTQSYPDNASFINIKLGMVFLSNGGNACR